MFKISSALASVFMVSSIASSVSFAAEVPCEPEIRTEMYKVGNRFPGKNVQYEQEIRITEIKGRLADGTFEQQHRANSTILVGSLDGSQDATLVVEVTLSKKCEIREVITTKPILGID